MAERLGRLVGLAAIVLLLARFGRVLETVVDTPDWRLVAPAALVGGALVTWATSRLGRIPRLLVHLGAVGVVAMRVAAPDTLSYGIVPGTLTLPTMGGEVAYAFEILRFGAAPVLAVSGLVALLAGVAWAIGAAWAWSASEGPAWVGIAAPLGLYIYLAVVDRAASGLTWNLTFAVVVSLGLVATGRTVPAGAGRLRGPDRRPRARWQVGPSLTMVSVTVLAGVLGAGALSGAVPDGGALDWRNAGGEGSGLGNGFSGSRFAGLRQSILSLSDDPVFVAALDAEPAGGTTGYWRLLTLDEFDGEQWGAGDQGFSPLDASEPVPVSGTEAIGQTIRIEGLRDDRLPALLSPVELASDDPIIRSGAAVGDDATLQVSARTQSGLTYRVSSQVPTLDLAALASADGQLTPLFARAVDDGEIFLDPDEGGTVTSPEDLTEMVSLPADTDPAVATLAREVTQGTTSPFEQALLLEAFLRTFDYSTDVTTGHSSLDLAAWLTDPESQNYRTGYCEQFATAMAVMARSLGLPSRVVIGFTPGEDVDTPEGDVRVVRERNAHAWVEVWLDGHGWVGFDPTPLGDGTGSSVTAVIGFDPGTIDLPRSETDVAGDQSQLPDSFGEIPFPESGLGPVEGAQTNSTGWWILAGLALAAMVAAVPVWKGLRTRRRVHRVARGDVTAAWEEMTDRLTDLGDGPALHVTPIEFASATARELVPLAQAYAATIYGDRQITNAELHLANARRWLEDAYDPARRARAAFSSRSLRR